MHLTLRSRGSEYDTEQSLVVGGEEASDPEHPVHLGHGEPTDGMHLIQEEVALKGGIWSGDSCEWTSLRVGIPEVVEPSCIPSEVAFGKTRLTHALEYSSGALEDESNLTQGFHFCEKTSGDGAEVTLARCLQPSGLRARPVGRCREGSEGYRRPDDQDQHPPRPPPEEHSSEKTRDNCGPPVHLGSKHA